MITSIKSLPTGRRRTSPTAIGRRPPEGFPIGTRRAAVITAMHSAENDPLAMRVQNAARAERKDCLHLAFSISFRCELRHPDGPSLRTFCHVSERKVTCGGTLRFFCGPRGMWDHVGPWGHGACGAMGHLGATRFRKLITNHRTPLWVTNSKKRGKHPELVDSCSKARSQDENYDSEKKPEPPGMF